METKTDKGILETIWSSKKFHIWMDCVRIVTLISIIFIIFYLIKEIEAVKLLAYDPCKVCQEFTGCSCFCLK